MNATKIITLQDHKMLFKTHKKLMWMQVHIYSVKAKSQAGNVWVKDIMTTKKDQICKILS